jgi:prepilin-type N-terminal cleavage/methylation domain-containing protein
MEPIVKFSKRSQGFSIIEILIALAILLIVMLALFEAATLYIKQNMDNILRDEAVRVTQDVLYNLRSQDYSVITTSGTISASNDCVDPGKAIFKKVRDLRSERVSGTITDFEFDVCWSVVEDASKTRKTVTVVTTYTLLNQKNSTQASLVVIPQ